MIELRGLTKHYREGELDRAVFRDIDLTIATGETVALFGRSGSGKSTLLNLISGIDLPTSGEIRVEGTSLTALTEQGRTLFRRAHIGLIYQFFNLIPTLTVLENVLLPLELNRRTGAAARKRAFDLLEQVGLSGRHESFPDRLSGGEQQRVALARALVHEPAVVLADEPTGNLDEETGTLVLDLLERLTRHAGHTLVIVSHSPEVARMADRVLYLHEGRLEERPERGTPRP